MQCTSSATCNGAECVETNVWGVNVCGKPASNPPPSNPPPSNPPPTTPPGTPTPNPDTEGPKVTITSPAANALVAASLTVSASVTDNVGVARVDVLVNDVTLGSRTAGPFDFALVLKPGLQLIKVVGYDAWGNKGEATISVSVQSGSTSSPTPVAPTPGQTGSGIYGDACVGPKSCQSGMCALDSATNQQFCTQACNALSPCPASADCVATSNGSSVCAPKAGTLGSTPGKTRPSDQMTCSVGERVGLGDLLGGLFALGLLALLRRRRSR